MPEAQLESQVSDLAPAHYRLRVEEEPTTSRYMLSDGTVIDVEAYNNTSAVSGRIIEWAEKELGLGKYDSQKNPHGAKIAGSITLVNGVIGAPVIVDTWEQHEAPAPKPSSSTLKKRSTPTKGKLSVRTKNRSQ